MSKSPVPVPNVQAEACFTTVSALSNLLRRDFCRAKNKEDLKRRLADKGFLIRQGHLATAPHGKLICPVDNL